MTAYVGYILSTIPSEKTFEVAKQSWELLKQCERRCGGWGWSYFTPSDADSTTWALRLAKSLQADNDKQFIEAIKFMESHQNKNGGISTYEIENFVNFGKSASSEKNELSNRQIHKNILETNKGWFDLHTCVTAASSNIEQLRDKCFKFLEQTQESDGRWESIWWPGSEFATALAVTSLSEYGNNKFNEMILKSIKWAETKIRNDGAVYSESYKNNSPFATASCLKILLSKSKDYESDKIKLSLQWLLDNQKEDGSWEASALMYHPESTEVDDKKIHTTATVLEVLNIYLNSIEKV